MWLWLSKKHWWLGRTNEQCNCGSDMCWCGNGATEWSPTMGSSGCSSVVDCSDGSGVQCHSLTLVAADCGVDATRHAVSHRYCRITQHKKKKKRPRRNCCWPGQTEAAVIPIKSDCFQLLVAIKPVTPVKWRRANWNRFTKSKSIWTDVFWSALVYIYTLND